MTGTTECTAMHKLQWSSIAFARMNVHHLSNGEKREKNQAHNGNRLQEHHVLKE